MEIDIEQVRMVEALLFAAAEPVEETELAARLPEGAPLSVLLGTLQAHYDGRGIQLVKRGRRWLFETAPDLAFLLRKDVDETRKLSRAAVETLAIVAYHQPVSRTEIEDIRGVSLSKGTLDVLIEAGWVRPVGRRQTPGRPVVYGTTQDFLAHFGLETIKDLPGLEDLRAAGLLDAIDVQLATEQRLREADLAEPLLPLEDMDDGL
jgi:segregation and condensation protein B